MYLSFSAIDSVVTSIVDGYQNQYATHASSACTNPLALLHPDNKDSSYCGFIRLIAICMYFV